MTAVQPLLCEISTEPLSTDAHQAAVAGAAWAVVHPDRGIPDLVADTRLVPR